MSLYRRAYDRMAAEYRERFPGPDHPKKISVPIRRDEKGLVEAYVNTMFGRLGDGSFGAKTVYVDEFSGRLAARTTVFDSDGRVVTCVDAADLTAIRCGLMTAFAIEQFYDAPHEALSHLVVGLIGCGRINLAVSQMLHEIHGIRNFLVKGGPSGRTPNFTLVPGNVMSAGDYGHVRLCDVVVSCTTNVEPAQMMSVPANFHLAGEPKLFVAHDGGWLFNESFRNELPNFADHPDQIDVEHDFPFDSSMSIPAIHNLNQLRGLAKTGNSAIAYLSGMAMSDVIMAQEWHRAFQGETLDA